MPGKFIFLFVFLFAAICSLFAQGSEAANHELVIRGEVYIDLEPMYIGHIDEEYPLNAQTAGQRALDELSLFFSAMVYGWAFNYEIGERARGITENFELEQLGVIQRSDPAMRVTDTSVSNSQLRVWADYQLNDAQRRRMNVWRTNIVRNAQAVGYGPSAIDEYPGWFALKKMALEDAAKNALRVMLQGSERNRPKEVNGFISLASFPRYYIESGRWAVSARFRVQVTDIIPFAAY